MAWALRPIFWTYIHGYLTREYLPRETSVTLLNTVSNGKRPIYHGESVRCNCIQDVLNRLIATVIIHVTMSLWSKAKWLPAHGNDIVRPLKKVTIQPISHYKHSLVTCRQNIQSKIFILLPEKTVAWSWICDHQSPWRDDNPDCSVDERGEQQQEYFIIWQWILIPLAPQVEVLIKAGQDNQ